MYEQMLLNLIISSKDWSGIVRKHRLDESYFPAYPEVFRFLDNHYRKYHTVPDVSTVLSEFEDFEVMAVDESPRFLYDRLKEQKLYGLLIPSLKKVAKLSETDSVTAIEALKEEATALIREMATRGEAQDLAKLVEERLAEYQRRSKIEGLLGIPSGIEGLDAYTHGFLGGELINIVGYSGEGKSWLLLFFLVVAWLCGKKVLLISLEMDELSIGYRFDSLLSGRMARLGKEAPYLIDAGFSNARLIPGRLEESDEKGYEKYAEWLKNEGGFLIFTSKDFGGLRPTPGDIEALIEEYRPDIVGVDQLSLLDDDGRKARTIRERYINILREEKQICLRQNVPIVQACQANRESVDKTKSKKGDGGKAPEKYQASESNAVLEDADKFIALKRNDRLLGVSLKKNRLGVDNIDVMMIWGIDNGDIRELTKEAMF